MSNKNTLARTAAAIAERDAAIEAARQEHADISTAGIEQKLTAFAEVVRNTHRKMARPAGFDWALHHSFKVTKILLVDLQVEATNRKGERVTLTIPRSDLSLSTWQITGEIRRQSAQRFLNELKGTVATHQRAVTKARKEVEDAQRRLQQGEQALADARSARDRRIARTEAIQAKRDAAKARRQAAKTQPATDPGAQPATGSATESATTAETVAAR